MKNHDFAANKMIGGKGVKHFPLHPLYKYGRERIFLWLNIALECFDIFFKRFQSLLSDTAARARFLAVEAFLNLDICGLL